ncbi:MAG: fasciclin domain-containing protein, partial [Microcoleus sp. SIO2G3]|nr:fasciclin domain-containing protein [Microcoleus sp. SIO2G3]
NNIANALSQDTKYANLTRQLKEAGLLDRLNQPGNFTIFAPTNQAFEALPKDVFNKLSQPNNRLKVLNYHLVNRLITEQDIKKGSITTAEGTPIKITVDSEDTVKLNDAIGQHPSTLAKNGVIIEVDKVLIPKEF